MIIDLAMSQAPRAYSLNDVCACTLRAKKHVQADW